jgi:hypothetical protein
MSIGPNPHPAVLLEVAEGYLRLPTGQDESYWISFDGSHLLRGHWREFAEDSTPGSLTPWLGLARSDERDQRRARTASQGIGR